MRYLQDDHSADIGKEKLWLFVGSSLRRGFSNPPCIRPPIENTSPSMRVGVRNISPPYAVGIDRSPFIAVGLLYAVALSEASIDQNEFASVLL